MTRCYQRCNNTDGEPRNDAIGYTFSLKQAPLKYRLHPDLACTKKCTNRTSSSIFDNIKHFKCSNSQMWQYVRKYTNCTLCLCTLLCPYTSKVNARMTFWLKSPATFIRFRHFANRLNSGCALELFWKNDHLLTSATHTRLDSDHLLIWRKWNHFEIINSLCLSSVCCSVVDVFKGGPYHSFEFQINCVRHCL